MQSHGNGSRQSTPEEEEDLPNGDTSHMNGGKDWNHPNNFTENTSAFSVKHESSYQGKSHDKGQKSANYNQRSTDQRSGGGRKHQGAPSFNQGSHNRHFNDRPQEFKGKEYRQYQRMNRQDGYDDRYDKPPKDEFIADPALKRQFYESRYANRAPKNVEGNNIIYIIIFVFSKEKIKVRYLV